MHRNTIRCYHNNYRSKYSSFHNCMLGQLTLQIECPNAMTIDAKYPEKPLRKVWNSVWLLVGMCFKILAWQILHFPLDLEEGKFPALAVNFCRNPVKFAGENYAIPHFSRAKYPHFTCSDHLLWYAAALASIGPGLAQVSVIPNAPKFVDKWRFDLSSS